MARGVSSKLLTSLPDNYEANWLDRLDKRTKVARAVLERIAELESDAGGADSLSSARRSLIRHAAWLDAVVESHELRLAAGQQMDVGAYTQALNSLLGLYRLIGLERKPRTIRTLREVMNEETQESAGDETAEPASSSTRDDELANEPESSAAPEPSEAVTEGAP